MDTSFHTYIFLLVAIAFLVILADRIRIAYPIVVVVGGLVLSLLHVFPSVTIEPIPYL